MIGIIDLVPKQTYVEVMTPRLWGGFCLMGSFAEIFGWNLKREEHESGNHKRRALYHHLQKPRRGKSYMGSTVRHARQGLRAGPSRFLLSSC